VFIAGGDFKGGRAGTLAQLRAVTSIAVNFVIVCGHTGMLATGSQLSLLPAESPSAFL